MMRAIIFTWMIVWAAAAGAAEGVEVSATVDRNQVGVGDVIHLVISVSSKESANVAEPVLGNLPGFELINTSTGYETRSSYAGGKFITEQARTFTYMLAATRKGSLTIPDIGVNVNGQVHRTKPITVAVSDARANPPVAKGGSRGAPPDPFEQLDDMEELFQRMLQRRLGPGGLPGGGQPVNPDDAFFIQAEVDKTKVYVGEQVTANFYLVTRGHISDIDTLKYPDLKGFWKEDLEMATRLNFENVVLNGAPAQRALLVSYALFPMKAGKAVVDPYKAKCTVLTPLGFGMGRPMQLVKSSTPIEINVQELPAARPPSFTGAVGAFRVSARFEPPTGSVNNPVTLRVRFEGQGNAKLIELPKLGLPPSFELYDQKSQAKYLKDGQSHKEFEVLIIPRQPGVFKIPPVTVAVFEPGSGKFTEIASQPLELAVGGTAQPEVQQAQQQTGDKGPSAPPEPGGEPPLPPLATEMGGTVSGAAAKVAVTALFYLASFAFLGFTGWRQLRSKPKKTSLKLVLKRRSAKVRELASAGEWRKMGVELTNTAYQILGELSEQGGASRELGVLLERTAPSLRKELSDPMRKLIGDCEALSFAPEALIGEMTRAGKPEQLISEFEKIMGRAIELAEI